MSAAHPMYPLDRAFVRLERSEGPASALESLPTLLTFSDDWDWFANETAAGETATVVTPRLLNPLWLAAGAAIGLFGAALMTLAASAMLLVAVLVA
jgi:hypothetical protein